MYLHSTMLLLYRVWWNWLTTVWIEFTFHYASTLSSRAYTATKYLSKFTFHYASTLSKVRNMRTLRFIDLHSTMLLLYLSADRTGRCVWWIYIPLCFYFINRRGHRRWITNIIYIPLCFYFIGAYRGGVRDFCSEFTFHYASTLSAADLKNLIWLKNLHSTMLLLYRASPQHMLHHISIIYIPLCFYFIEKGQCSIIVNSEFTFHYASTLSGWIMCSIPSGYRFTFHYASTLSCSLPVSRICSPIYIPLCFYFILPAQMGAHSFSSFTFHYASTLSCPK